MTSERIVIVDDERSLRETLAISLEAEAYEISVVDSAERAIALLKQFDVSVIVTDLKMSGASGLDLLRIAKEMDESIEVILMTAFGTTETAVEAMKQGAYDYVVKPFNLDELRVLIRRAIERRKLTKENLNLKRQVTARSGGMVLAAGSAAMRTVVEMVQKIAPRDVTVLITGESGVGKEVVARSIHGRSNRASGPFIAVNCGALPENLVEAELFGYEKGAFTGADKPKPGLLEFADGGTLFLDEVGELPLGAQVKLLRVLQEQTVRRLGDSKERRLNIRVVSATNKSLEQQVVHGAFREDLFYRLNVIRIEVPPLRERREDIPVLIETIAAKITANLGIAELEVEPEALQALATYTFPGNVRELENILERAVILSGSGKIGRGHLPPEVRGFVSNEPPGDSPAGALGEGFDLEKHIETVEKHYFREALIQAGGVRTKAAELLGLSFRQFRYKAKKFGL